MRPSRHGLIGYPLGHSLSPFIHESLLAAAGIPGHYELIEIAPERLAQAFSGLAATLDGFNVTIPHKEAIIPLLDGMDPSAADFGAVNTVFNRRGYNTDRTGFVRQGLALKGQRVLVIGAGGVSRMMAYESARAGAHVTIASRTWEKADRMARQLGVGAVPLTDLMGGLSLPDFDVILNGSPAGMWPKTGDQPVPDDLLATCHTVYDTIYNPAATRMLLKARSIHPASPADDGRQTGPARANGLPVAVNGLRMLFEQALEAERIWHPDATFALPDQQEILRRLPGRLLDKFPVRIVLTGFMGSGKTTVGKLLANRLSIPFMDLDEDLVRSAGKSIPEIFAERGEGWFRDLERRQLETALNRPESLVLAVGGGAMIEPSAFEAVRQHPTQIVYLHVPLAELAIRLAEGQGRPMLAGDVGERITSLYHQRFSRYLAHADLTVDGSGDAEAVAADLARKLGYEPQEELIK